MIKNRNYPLLLWGQFFGAFGDNAILMIILGPLMAQYKAHAITQAQQSIANIVYASLLFAPYVLLAPWAGFLSDRYSKTSWLMLGNAIKLAGTAICLAGVWLGPFWKGVGYFIVGVGSCLYSPAKYGILPEILPLERLVKANGMVELLTLVAILTGTIGGSLLYDNATPAVCYGGVLALYLASMATILFMARTPAHPETMLAASFGEFKTNLRDLLTHPRLARVLVGTSLFWFSGATMKMNFQPWGQQVIGLQTMTQISLLGLWLSIGIMMGSVAAGYFYSVGELQACRKFGFILSFALLLLGSAKWLMESGFAHIQAFSIVVLMLAGLAGGLFLIPLNAALQAESPQGKVGKTIATQNGLENIAMLSSSLFAFINVRARFDPSQLFFGLAGFVALVVALLRIPPPAGVKAGSTEE